MGRQSEASALLRTCVSSATRHLLHIVAPGQPVGVRSRAALLLPLRIGGDVRQARGVVDGVLARRSDGRNRLWVFVDKRPDPLADSGSLRLTWALALARGLGYEVALYSVRERRWFEVAGAGDDVSLVPRASVSGGSGAGARAWIVQPQAAAVVLPYLAAARRLRTIYDSVDVHHLRLRREAEVTRSRGRRLQARLMRQLERQAVAAADVTIAVSEAEVPPLRDLGAARVAVLPNIHKPREDRPPRLAERSGLLFVGNFTHSPNVDAVEVLVQDVLPRVWTRRPRTELAIVGRAFPTRYFGRLDSRIKVLGWVRDLDRVADSSCLLAAPLRFGAGLKGKIGFALARGLPVVTTTVGAEGFPDSRGMAVCASGDWETFAAHVVELLGDADLWASRSEAGIDLVRERYSPDVLEPSLATILGGA